MKNYNNWILKFEDSILSLYIDRSHKLNAIDEATIDELDHIIDSSILKDSCIKGVIISGSGDKSFSAGADIKEISTLTSDEVYNLSTKTKTIFDKIENSNKPIIAAINGVALGGGLELALACHIRIIKEKAKIGLPEVKLGLIPGYGGTQRLSKLIGKSKAISMILQSRIIGAEEAFLIGLANKISTNQDIIQESRDMLKNIMDKSPIAIREVIRCVNHSDTSEGYDIESKSFSLCHASQYSIDSIKKFLTKKKA